MTEPLKVLVWGTAEQGACAYFRGHLFDEPLKELGVELRHLKHLEFKVPKGMDQLQAFREGKVELDTSAIEWADVVMLRRYYNTSITCETKDCGFRTHDFNVAAAHEHKTRKQDDITRIIWPAIRDLWEGAIVYETDDNHWRIKPWNGYYRDVLEERDLIDDMARNADLITVATPALARAYGHLGPNMRVIRNALDPDLYVADTERPEGDDPRLVYYGSTARLRDYAGYPDERGRWKGGYARHAVDAQQDHLRRIFLGTNGGTEHIVGALFDEQTPYIEDIPAFCRALANAHGDIGIAPLGGDDFDQCKSELHWMEYGLTGHAFIGERMKGEAPYSVIREGVDGLLAKGAQEWHDAVARLVREPNLRADLAAAARERVLAEYDYRQRAHEWADAFRWAAEHAGSGRRARAAAA